MKINKNFVIFLFLLLFSCGYSPLLKNMDLSSIKIKSINVTGPTNLSFFLKSNFAIKENNFEKKGSKINLDINQSTSSKTKNAAGITIEEEISININLTIQDFENKTILKDQFSDSKIISVTNNPSSDNEIKRIEAENLILNLLQKINFSIQSQLGK